MTLIFTSIVSYSSFVVPAWELSQSKRGVAPPLRPSPPGATGGTVPP
jgi:hypothetical protein